MSVNYKIFKEIVYYYLRWASQKKTNLALKISLLLYCPESTPVTLCYHYLFNRRVGVNVR